MHMLRVCSVQTNLLDLIAYNRQKTNHFFRGKGGGDYIIMSFLWDPFSFFVQIPFYQAEKYLGFICTVYALYTKEYVLSLK
jgi:hypothetical protein